MKNIIQETFEKHVKLVRKHFNLNENTIFYDEPDFGPDLATLQKINDYIKNGMKGDLDISGTSIEKLPDTLTHVGGSLHASKCKNLKDLGKLEHVGRWLYINSTSIEKLPDTLKYVGGRLAATNCKNLKDLGKLEKVGEYLNITGNTLIEKLPDTLKYIGGNLIATDCKNLKDLGGLEKVDGWINISYTSIEKLPDALKHVGGIDAFRCKNLKDLGGLEKVDGWLDISETSIEKLPDTLKRVGNKNSKDIVTTNKNLIVPNHLKDEVKYQELKPQPSRILGVKFK